MAAPKKNDGKRTKGRAFQKRAAVKAAGESNDWPPRLDHKSIAGIAESSCRSEQRCEAWVQKGRPRGEEPWSGTDWTAIHHLPEGRQVLRARTSALGVRSTGELKHMLGELADRARTLLQGSGPRNIAAPIADVLAALEGCIIAEGEAPEWAQGSPSRPRKPAWNGIDVERLKPLAKEARKVLGNIRPTRGDPGLDRAISPRALARFEAAEQHRRQLYHDTLGANGEVTINGFGAFLVQAIRGARAEGLSGNQLAQRVIASGAWPIAPGHFYGLRRLRWREDLRAKVGAFFRGEVAGDDLDPKKAAIGLPVELGVDRQAARNAIVAAERNRLIRKRSANE